MFRIRVFFLFLLVLSSCSYLNARDEDLPKKETITGRVYFMGSEPFASVGLSAFDGRTFALLSEDEKIKEISDLQNTIITVKGYVDKEIKYPQKSIIVDEYKKIDVNDISGHIYKMGKGVRAHYYIQANEKTYEVVTEKSIQLEKMIGKIVEVKGYIYEMDDSVDNVYVVSVELGEEH